MKQYYQFYSKSIFSIKLFTHLITMLNYTYDDFFVVNNTDSEYNNTCYQNCEIKKIKMGQDGKDQ